MAPSDLHHAQEYAIGDLAQKEYAIRVEQMPDFLEKQTTVITRSWFSTIADAVATMMNTFAWGRSAMMRGKAHMKMW